MKFYTFLIIFIVFSLNVNAWNSYNHKALVDKVYYSLDFETQKNLNLSSMEEGSIVPDKVFHDVRLHHYPPSYNKSLFWLDKAKIDYRNKNYNEASDDFGIAAHYISDSFVAPHYISKEPGSLHSKFENIKDYRFKTECHDDKLDLEENLIIGSKNKEDWGLWIVNQTYDLPKKEIEQSLYTLYPFALETFNSKCNDFKTEIVKRSSITGFFTWILDIFK